VGAREIIYWHRERRPQLLSRQTRPTGTDQKVSRTPSDYKREGEQVRRCLECGSELESNTDIVLHTCKAYPPKEEVNSWAELFLNNLKREGE
jgi:hypothetical protein